MFYRLPKKIWPSKEVWERCSSEDTVPVRGDRVDCWQTGKNQKKGDVFMLKIVKPRTNLTLKVMNTGFRIHKNWDIGQERVIDRIQFIQSPFSAVAFPLRYSISISNAYGFIPGWIEHEGGEDDFSKRILIEFPHPLKIRSFTVKIIESRQGKYWGFDRIDIREVRLLGRFWRHTI